jgi:hypothetical protein
VKLLALLLVAACGSSSSTPPAAKDAAPVSTPAVDTPAAAVSAAIALLDDLAGKVAAAGDCAAQGKVLAAWLQTHASERAAVTARLRALPESQTGPEIESQLRAPGHAQLVSLFSSGAQLCVQQDPTFAHAWADTQTMFLP